MRTLALNLSLIGLLWLLAPAATSRAISTRGDWIFDGHDGAISRHARSLIFAIGDGLQGHLQKARKVYGKSDEGPKLDTELPPTASEPIPVPIEDDTEEDTPLRYATKYWPVQSTLSSAIVDMPNDVQGSYIDVAAFIESQFQDPYARTIAIHDYIALRLTYDQP